jgi:predicted permease
MINSSGIFVAATQSVGTAATLAGAGFYFHRRVILKRNNHQKNNDGGKNNAVIIDDTAGKKMLALISQQVTIPAFLFTKIVRCPPSIDGDGIEAESNDCPSLIDNLGNDLWMMLFLPFFVVTCGLIIGRLAAFLSATPSRQTKIVMATCAFANSTGLPITLLTVVHSNFPASTKLGRHDPTIFLSIYLLLYPVLQWGIGGWLLSPTDTQHHDSNNDQKIVIEDKNHINGAFASSNSSSSLTSINSSISSSPSCEEISVTPLHHDEEIQLSMIHCENDNQITEEDKLCDKVVERRFLLDSDLENEHQDFDSSSLPNNYVNGDIDDVKNNHGLVGTNQNFFPTKVHSMLTSKMYIVKNIVWNALQPPIIAALLGIFILSIPSLRGVFVNITSQDKTAPLNFLFDGLCIVSCLTRLSFPS